MRSENPKADNGAGIIGDNDGAAVDGVDDGDEDGTSVIGLADGLPVGCLIVGFLVGTMVGASVSGETPKKLDAKDDTADGASLLVGLVVGTDVLLTMSFCNSLLSTLKLPCIGDSPLHNSVQFNCINMHTMDLKLVYAMIF